MKTIKQLIILLFLFSSIQGFSQNPTIKDTNICNSSGSLASIKVDVTSVSATFVWQLKTPTTGWTTITSSNASTVYTNYNSNTLNIVKTPTLPVTGTMYRVIVNLGLGDLTSNEATLTVDPIPVSKTITGASPVCVGDSRTLSYGTGSVGEIQWQSSTTSNSADFFDVNGETSRTYAAYLDETTWLRVRNTSGVCDPVYSPAVQVVVNQLVTVGNIDGGDINVCKTANSTELTLYNYDGDIQWQKASDVGGSPGNFSNITTLANSPTYIATSLTATTYFRVLLTSGVCTSDYTEPVVIAVDPTPVTKLITGASPVCSGDEKQLTYGAGSVGDILWQYSTTSNTADFIDLDGETERTLMASSYLDETTWFRVMNTSGECGSLYSPAVQVVVNPEVVVGSIVGGDINVCKDINSTVLNMYNSEGDIQWQKASDVGGSPGSFSNIATLANASTYTAASLSATTYFRAKISSGVCPSDYTDYVIIAVDSAPVSKLITGASPTCVGGNKVLVYGSDSVGDIQWQYSTTSSSSNFENIIDEYGLTYLATNLQETTWFRVMNSSGACSSVYSPAVEVFVNPPLVAGYIEGGNISVSKESNATDLTLNNYKGNIQWQKAATLTGEYQDIPFSNLPTYNASGLKTSTYFRTLLSNGVCNAVASDPVLINVNSNFNAVAFPNPFNSVFNLEVTPFKLEPISLKVYDSNGREIENRYIKSSEISSLQLGENYADGFYTLLIMQGNELKKIKIIKK